MCFLYEIEGNKVELYSNGQEEIVSSIETFKEMRPLLEEFKPPWHHSASIFHGFKDPFMREESARDESFPSLQLHITYYWHVDATKA